MKTLLSIGLSCLLVTTAAADPAAFEGRISAVLTQGGETTALLYTAGPDSVRIEVTGSTRHPVDLVDLNSGAITLVFPHNRSFVHLKPDVGSSAFAQFGPPEGATPNVPPGIGPQPHVAPTGFPPRIGPTNLPGGSTMPNPPAMPSLPASWPPGTGPQRQPNTPGAQGMPFIPAMPVMAMPMENLELRSTGEKTNLLGFACQKYEIKQRGEVMEIWATDQLLPFRDYVRHQAPRFGPRMMEERWAELLTPRKLFPLHASLRFEGGPERYRFEVQSVTPQKLTKEDMKLFQPPDGYFEMQALPF